MMQIYYYFLNNRVMEKEFSAISELKSIREQKSRLSEREQELSEPVLHDYSIIGMIYQLFKEILLAMPLPPCVDSPTQRKKFIFIILFLYSPSTLAGRKMKVGLRDKIAEVTGCKGSLISHNCEDVTFFYQQYKSYRQDIDYLYTEIVNRLKVKGLINGNAGA